MGRRWKDVIESQKNEREKGEGSRYRTLVFWLWADSNILNERLDDRVDKMVEVSFWCFDSFNDNIFC